LHATQTIDVRSGWAIHERPLEWPVRAGQVFIVAAFDQILHAMFSLNGPDLLADPIDNSAYGTAAASQLRDAVMTGTLTTRVQPVSGGPLLSMAPSDWTPALIDAAIATGQVRRRLNRRSAAHWVFVDGAELTLMRKVLGATNMLYDESEYGPLEELGDIVLRNMPAIAKPPSETDPVADAEAVIRLFIPSGRFDFDKHDDRDRFVTAAVTWLNHRFAEDPKYRLGKKDFWKMAESSFGPYMSGRTFERVWNQAVEQPKKDDDTPDLSKPDPHKRRRTAGRRNSI
jgi:hypothetical protein